MSEPTVRAFADAAASLYARLQRLHYDARLYVRAGPLKRPYLFAPAPGGDPHMPLDEACRVLRDSLRVWWGHDVTVTARYNGAEKTLGPLCSLLRPLELAHEIEAVLRASEEPLTTKQIARRCGRANNGKFRAAMAALKRDGMIVQPASRVYALA